MAQTKTMPQPETKPFWQSQTFIGLGIMLLPIVFNLFGWELTPEGASALMVSVESIIQVIGAAVAGTGRVKARKTITL